jgi:Mn2+/Fe2+ NRAMP family transporter
VTEFAAINEVSTAFGISPYIGVPLAGAALVAVVITGSYRRWERIITMLCLLDTFWFVLAFLVKPSLGEILANSLIPQTPAGGWTGRDRGTARATLGEGLSVSAFPLYVPV